MPAPKTTEELAKDEARKRLAAEEQMDENALEEDETNHGEENKKNANKLTVPATSATTSAAAATENKKENELVNFFVVKGNTSEEVKTNVEKLKAAFEEVKQGLSEEERKNCSFNTHNVKDAAALTSLEAQYPGISSRLAEMGAKPPCQVIVINLPQKAMEDFTKKSEQAGLVEKKLPASGPVEQARKSAGTTPQRKPVMSDQKEQEQHSTPRPT